MDKTAGSANKSLAKGSDYERQFKRKKVVVAKDETSPVAYSSAPVAGNMLVGAHVSAAGGLHNSVENALKIGCRSFALFVRNQRTWKIKPLEESDVALFREALDESKVKRVCLHLLCHVFFPSLPKQTNLLVREY